MAIWNIKDSADRTLGTINDAPTAQAAIAKFITDRTRPVYCRLHDEIPADRRSADVGQMGYYTPQMPRPAHAIRMREFYLNGGYMIEPDPEAVAA